MICNQDFKKIHKDARIFLRGPSLVGKKCLLFLETICYINMTATQIKE